MICENCLRKDTCKEVCIDLEWEINPLCQKCRNRYNREECKKCERIKPDYIEKHYLPELFIEQLKEDPEQFPMQSEEWAKKSLYDKVYELHFIDHMKPSEIAHLVGCSRRRVYQIIEKIRNK